MARKKRKAPKSKKEQAELKSKVEEFEKVQAEVELEKEENRRNLKNAKTKNQILNLKRQMIELQQRRKVLNEKRLESLSRLHFLQLQAFFNKLSTQLTNYVDKNDWDFLLQSTATSIIESGVDKLLEFLQRHYGESVEYDPDTSEEDADELENYEVDDDDDEDVDDGRWRKRRRTGV